MNLFLFVLVFFSFFLGRGWESGNLGKMVYQFEVGNWQIEGLGDGGLWVAKLSLVVSIVLDNFSGSLPFLS